jgi:UDP-3-O-[3-hydroxymyristoyl] glucosamine N-acyltransferase
MNKKNYTLEYIARKLNLNFIGDKNFLIKGVSTPEKSNENDIVIIFDRKYIELIGKIKSKVILTFEDIKFENINFIYSNDPKKSLPKLLSLFENKYLMKKNNKNYISKTAIIGKHSYIGHFSYIGDNVKIGNNVKIFPNSFIGDNSCIGDNTIIYPNVSILKDSIIGKNVIIHSGSTIGSDGYGYIQDENNNHYKIPQIGNVIVEDFVEIGSNVCIDRGTLGSTIIKKGTKVDNLVHIAHNVIIGERNLIIAQVGIAGSTQIGNDVIIAGQSGINGHLKIGNNCIIMGKSGVTKNLKDFSKVSGFPAKDYRQDLKEKIYIKKIPKIIDYIERNK